MDPGTRVRPSRPARADHRGAGLGWPDRATAGGGEPRPVRPGRGGQHRAAHRGRADAGRLAPVPGGRSHRAHAERVRLVQSGCRTTLSPDVLAAYEAPFPDPSYAAAVRAMPELVPTTPDDPASEANRAAWRQLAAWDKPFLVAFSDRDPITGAMAPVLKGTVPGAAGLEHPVIEGAGHFLQEDAGERLGTVIAEFVRAHPA